MAIANLFVFAAQLLLDILIFSNHNDNKHNNNNNNNSTMIIVNENKNNNENNKNNYKRVKPNRIILIRHAESEANVNERIYREKHDSLIEITEKGELQANLVGEKLKKLVGDEKLHVFVSPYARTMMTSDVILRHLDAKQLAGIRIDPRLREQEMGNLQGLGGEIEEESHKKLRKQIGRFFYRFPTGESGADVYDRVGSLLDSIYRVASRNSSTIANENFLLITHGLTMRLFLMRHFHWSPDTFETVSNPTNCTMWVLEKNDVTGDLEFTSVLGDDIQSSRKISVVMKNGDVEEHEIKDYLSLPQPRMDQIGEIVRRLGIDPSRVDYIDWWNGNRSKKFVKFYAEKNKHHLTKSASFPAFSSSINKSIAQNTQLGVQHINHNDHDEGE